MTIAILPTVNQLESAYADQPHPEALARLDLAKTLIGAAILQHQSASGKYDENLTEAHALLVGVITQLEGKS